MNTTMHEHKVTKKQAGIITAVAGFSLLGGGLISNNVLGQASASPDARGHMAQANDKSHRHNQGVDAALLVDAVELHLTTKEMDPNRYSVVQLDIEGDWARGGIDDGANTVSRFFAHKESGKWVILYDSQTTLPQDVANKFGFPNNWTNQEWFNNEQ